MLLHHEPDPAWEVGAFRTDWSVLLETIIGRTVGAGGGGFPVQKPPCGGLAHPYNKSRWLIMDSGLLSQKQPQEGFEESFSSISGVVDELEEAEVGGKMLLRDPAAKSQPGS